MIMQNYIYNATIINVVDGDTVDVRIDLGFYTHTEQRMRLNGIDTKELNSQILEERELAKAAKILVQKYLNKGCTVVSYKKDKYGRFLADIYIKNEEGVPSGTSLNNELIASGLAVPYFGGVR
jgi:micrococcal nuclease